jgi:hypothetical protein
MTKRGHLWAIEYSDVGRAEQVRQEILKLGATPCLTVLDTAVVVRYPDGVATLDGGRSSFPLWMRSCKGYEASVEPCSRRTSMWSGQG